MPTGFVKKVSSECNMSLNEVEKLWTQAKELAQKEGRTENDSSYFPYVIGILKKSLPKSCREKLMKEHFNGSGLTIEQLKDLLQ